MKRKILVILSDRLNRLRKPRYVEMDCDEKGTILHERFIRSLPNVPRYDEVWENDEGKKSTIACNRFKRKYRHKLEKPPRPVKSRKR